MASGPKFFDLASELDSLLAEPPTRERLARFKELTNIRALRDYAFGKLDSPAWIEPLHKLGFFAQPPAIVVSRGRDGSEQWSYPWWSESQFLARLAARAPHEVARIVSRIPTTDNFLVRADLVRAAIAMPPDVAARLARRECEWVERQTHLWAGHTEPLGDLISHLAKGGQLVPALRLARATLGILPDPTGGGAEAVSLPPMPRARCDVWEYGRLLQKNVPDLVKAARLDALAVLCDLLASAVRLSKRERSETDYADYSFIWYPDIGRGTLRGAHSVREILVAAVRDYADELLKDGLDVAQCVRALEKRRFTVFRRLSLHILTTHGEKVPDEVSRLLTDKRLFDDSTCRVEYSRLAEKFFAMLPALKRTRVLRWITVGPKDEVLRDWHRRARGEEASDSELAERRAIWQRDHIALLGTAAPTAIKEQFDQLVEAFGAPARAAFEATVRWGDEGASPVAVAGLSAGDVVELVNRWDETNETPMVRNHAFALALQDAAAKSDLVRDGFIRFQELDVRYAAPLFFGLRQALGGQHSLPWPDVLAFAAWAVGTGSEEMARGAGNEERTAIRRAVAQFLNEALSSESRAPSIDHRAALWAVILPITDDRDPSLENEDGSLDPATLSINTSRGEAMHAAVRYALWVRRSAERSGHTLPSLANGLDEVVTALDHHLDESYEPSAAVRSVYGQWFPWLVLLDEKWAAARTEQIFGRGERSGRLARAAWESYITFCAPYDSVFKILASTYKTALERIGTWTKGGTRLADPDERLAEHVAALYWREQVEYGDPTGLIQGFYDHANPELRAHLIQFVGRSLHNNSSVPSGVIERLQSLWKNRLAAVATSASTTNAEELEPFGWWFTAEKFDLDWGLAQLREALKLTSGRIDPDHLVVQTLAGAAERRPIECVEALSLILLGEHEWPNFWPDQTRQILTSAARSESDDAKRAAEDLVQALGMRGRFDFRDLAIPRATY